MLSSLMKKSKTVELQAVNAVKEKLKIDKKLIMSLFDTYFKRTVGEELDKLNDYGGSLINTAQYQIFSLSR